METKHSKETKRGKTERVLSVAFCAYEAFPLTDEDRWLNFSAHC